MTTIQSILYRLTEVVSGTDKELYTEDELNKFASFYLDKWDENTSENIFILNTQMRNGLKSARTTTRVITPNGKVSLFFL